MNSYLLIRNNTYYFRRRISKKHLSFFEHKEELRIKLVTKSKIRAMIAIELINRAFEETIMLLNNHISIHKLCCPTPEILYDGNTTALKYLLDKTADYAIMDKLEDFNIEQKQSVINNFELLNKLDNFMQLIDPKNLINQIQGTNKQAQQEVKKSISFKKLYEIFIKEKKLESRDKEADIAESTWRDYQSSYNDFIYVIEGAEDKDIGEFTRDDFRNYTNALHNHIPKSRTKLKQFRDLHYQELKEVTLLDAQKMAYDTKKKKISTIKQIFDIAIDPKYAYLKRFSPQKTKRKKNGK